MNKRKKLLLAKQAFRKSVPVGTTEWGRKIDKDIKSNNFCRCCGHAQIWHINKEGYCGGVIGIEDTLDFDQLCKCKEYEPKGNLEYLEWKAEQKKKKKCLKS